jgi:hypothetical protein
MSGIQSHKNIMQLSVDKKNRLITFLISTLLIVNVTKVHPSEKLLSPSGFKHHQEHALVIYMHKSDYYN